VISIDLTGRAAIVTGASQGLGEASARTLHAAGANVVVNYVDDQSANRTLAESIAAPWGKAAMTFAADVRRTGEVAAMFAAAVERFGQVDIVVNNAAILRDRSVRKMTDAEWHDVIDTNLSAVFNVCRQAALSMADGGRIVNMASLSAMIGFFGQANYAAAKAGVIGLTKVLSRELARRRITVNAVAPGVVLTEMGRSIPEENRRKMLEQIPLERFAEPEEIATTILFLCSPLASYITGQTIHVNGGWWG
jgi:3-oxoacyl-[acyl-carrier protein] reductase